MMAARRWRAASSADKPVGAEEDDDPAAILPQIVNALDQGIHSDLVFMVAVLLRAGGCQGYRPRR